MLPLLDGEKKVHFRLSKRSVLRERKEQMLKKKGFFQDDTPFKGELR